MSDDDDELTPDEEEAWCAEMRDQVVDYLQRQPGRHGQVGEWPGWRMAPYVSVWAVESLKAPGSVGWWVISGDLPTDYCSSSEDCNNPRRAMRRFAESWRRAIAATPEDAATLGDTCLPVEFADMLASRADFLLEMVRDDELWPEDVPDRDSSTNLH
ncbi:MAG: DUF4826 family protein [Phenylobacterium sp.]|uniref:DUF4826 family protein n=1 Tax=Phenylobacterium sp. TaxID=1871053 RepID=UPI001A370BBE|nr:DUF4826 family protein [Phenylobacterium sp.]MBL8554364.1 DUF4826 family protein [Phenylobacterium sp.]